ncbi:DDE-type integrase/transposase/recombinase [Leptospira borgpetersenii]|uniref:DDE-type integrase/transposase/recombinase n=1 Tax=Leptospira borgpetersenii TaxID=174 RepID=UPI001D13BCCA|nr:DDE-type integrase/transposase/recombinase [Leptospira borgpetersenii]
MIFVSDITYIRVKDGFAYLSLIANLYSRKIVSFKLYPSLETEGRIHALKTTLAQIPKDKKIIHHSDRGTQFCSKGYTDILFNEGHRISMTEENHCYENPVAERINKTLNSNSGYIILLIVLKKLKSPSIKPPAFTTHSGCISISVISLLILFIKLHNFCQLDFRSLQFLRKAVCFFIFISCILNS